MTVKDSTLIRIPLSLKAELEAAAADLLRIHSEGKGALPPEFCEHVPLHYVIKRALDDTKAKRARSAAPRRKATIHSVDTVDAIDEGRVNTIHVAAKGQV